MSEKPIVVGITQGDINGISYEIITKTFMDSRMMEVCTPLVYGSSKAASYHRKLIKSSGDLSFHIIKQADQLSHKNPNMINIVDKELKIDIGESTQTAGEMAVMSLKMATEDLIAKKIDVLVTSPVNKKNIQSDSFSFPGQTEFLAKSCNTNDYLMLMIADGLKIGTVTTHCAISEISNQLKKEMIVKKIQILNKSLQQDFLITKPKIAVLSLNPHVGESGKFGKEEQNIITPAIEDAFNQGIYVFGPYAADGFFGTGQYSKFDGVLAMYHDQAMIPFKLLAYGEGVNFTAGLPFVRTSPAQGTAYDIAGKDMASPDSFRKAIYLACDIYRNRKQSTNNQ
jgi:4-hydroxythreonine-4-phosphate dehydrogenase